MLIVIVDFFVASENRDVALAVQSLRRLRMIRALELLAEDSAGITKIAFTVGYTSLSAFNAAFREFVGETPSSYQQGLRGAGNVKLKAQALCTTLI